MLEQPKTGRTLTFFLVLLFLAIMFASAGQILLKYSTTSSTWALPSMPMFNFYFFAAAFVYLASMLFYTVALKGLPITLAYPSMALSYVIVSGFSNIVWKTPFGLLQIVALVLMVIALGLLAFSDSTSFNSSS